MERRVVHPRPWLMALLTLKPEGGYIDMCHIFSQTLLSEASYYNIVLIEQKKQKNSFLSLYTQLICQGIITSFIFLFVYYIKKVFPFWCFNQQQAENQAQETKKKLDIAKQQSALEGGLAQLQTTLQRNRGEAVRAQAQAEASRHQAGGLEEVIGPASATKSRQTVLL